MDLLRRGRALIDDIPPWRRALYLDRALGGSYGVLVGGTVVTGLVLWAGGGPFELGLVSTLSALGGLIVLAIRRIQRRFSSSKRLTQVGWSLAWASWLPLSLLLVAIFLLGGASRGVIIPIALLTIFAAAALNAIGNVGWPVWVAELVPGLQRGGFIAQQARWMSLASLITLPIVGRILDETRGRQVDAIGFAFILALPFLCSALGWRLLSTVPVANLEPPRESASAVRRGLTEVPSIGRLSLYTVVFQAGIQLGAPFFQAYCLTRLGMSFSLITTLSVASQMIPILIIGYWGRVIDRAGLRIPLGLCSFGKLLVPTFYVLSTKDVWWPVLGAYCMSALDAGITVANGTMLAHVAEGRHGAARVAQFSLLTSLAATITPVVAGFLVANVQFGGIDTLALMFILSAIVRATGGLVLLFPERRREIKPRPGLGPPEPQQ